MGKIAQPRGKNIAKVGHLNIYQKNKQEMKDVNGKKVERTTATEISIYHGKKVVEGGTGFKNKATAIAKATELVKAYVPAAK